MKKSVLISILILSTVVAASGQSQHLQCSDHFASLRSGHAAAKTTTGNAARCIASSVYHNLGTSYILSDTSMYAYSGSRGGSILTGMKYDLSQTYTNTGSSIVNDRKYTQTFDSHNNILVHSEQQYDIPSGTFIYTYQTIYSYNAANKALTETTLAWSTTTSTWDSSSRNLNTYDAANNMITRTGALWDGTSWNNFVFDTITYNSANKITMDLGSGWNSSTSTWDPSSKVTFSYDASNNMTSQLIQYWGGTGWINQRQSLYSNFSAPDLYQQEIGQVWTGSSFENEFKDSITYNTYNQPVYNFAKPWSTTTSSWPSDTFTIIHYYYEIYSSGITNVNTGTTTMDVYPNPASDVINIKATVTGGVKTTITMMDVTGRVVRTIEGSEIKEGLNNIQCPTEQLPAGAYFIHLANDKASITRKVIINK